jgi:hypothetical protein
MARMRIVSIRVDSPHFHVRPPRDIPIALFAKKAKQKMNLKVPET